jgi:hypothetical protein
MFKVNKQPEGFACSGRPLFCPYFKTPNDQLPHIEELLDKPDRFYYVNFKEPDTNHAKKDTFVDTSAEEEEEEDEGRFNPKDIRIFDTNMFKSGLKFRDAINERVVIDKDASRGLVSYADYLRGVQSFPK